MKKTTNKEANRDSDAQIPQAYRLVCMNCPGKKNGRQRSERAGPEARTAGEQGSKNPSGPEPPGRDARKDRSPEIRQEPGIPPGPFAGTTGDFIQGPADPVMSGAERVMAMPAAEDGDSS